MHIPRFTIPLNQGLLERVETVVVFNPDSEISLEELGENLLLETDDAVRFQYFEARGYNTVSRLDGKPVDRSIVFLSKHTDHNKAMISRAWQMTKEGGDILVEGAKTDGADSMIRGLRALGLAPQVEPKSHGKIAWFTREENRVGAIDAWLALDDAYQNTDGFTVRPGIFSAKGLDKGSVFLIENLRVPLKGKVADFGGGYGALSAHFLNENTDIETLDVIETSKRAIECAQANVTDERANFLWQSVQTAKPANYDAIISNPPFHDGRKGDPKLGLDFISAAARSLRARGSFYMVANKHLPYEHRLNELFGHVDVIALSNAFKIFKATRPNSKKL